MAMISCPECKKRISDSAEVCPKCGKVMDDDAREQSRKIRKQGNMGCLILVVLVVVVGLVMEMCNAPSIPDHSQAVEYKILSEDGSSSGGRSRIERQVLVQGGSLTHKQLAHTAIKAALDLQEETGADVVWVWLNPHPQLVGTGDQLAKATYVPDGKGLSGDDDMTWEVEAANEMISERDIKISVYWFTLREQFQIEDNGLRYTDEPRLKAEIARAMDIPIDEVHLPFVEREIYFKE